MSSSLPGSPSHSAGSAPAQEDTCSEENEPTLAQFNGFVPKGATALVSPEGNEAGLGTFPRVQTNQAANPITPNPASPRTGLGRERNTVEIRNRAPCGPTSCFPWLKRCRSANRSR